MVGQLLQRQDLGLFESDRQGCQMEPVVGFPVPNPTCKILYASNARLGHLVCGSVLRRLVGSSALRAIFEAKGLIHRRKMNYFHQDGSMLLID